MPGSNSFPGNGMRPAGTALAAMRATPLEHRTFEFRFPDLDTLVKVEVRDERVTIRDPLVEFSLNWLGRTVPDADSPCVVVHGDVGPGNFLIEVIRHRAARTIRDAVN